MRPWLRLLLLSLVIILAASAVASAMTSELLSPQQDVGAISTLNQVISTGNATALISTPKNATLIKIKLQGMNFTSINSSLKKRIISLANRSKGFRDLIADGYSVKDILPVQRCKVTLNPSDNTVVVSSCKVRGGIVRLEKGDKVVYVTVYLDTGEVLVGSPG